METRIEFKEFYEDGYNPIILGIKEKLRWIVLNVPDCGSLTGFPRYAANVFVLMLSGYVLSGFVLGKDSLLGFLVSGTIAGYVGGLFFIKTFALMLFKALENYQAAMRRMEARMRK